MPPNRRVEHATWLAKEYQVDAVLFTYLKFCPCYGLAKNKFITSFQALGLPVLELAGDYSLGDLAALDSDSSLHRDVQQGVAWEAAAADDMLPGQHRQH